MALTGIDAVCFGVHDMDDAARFLNDWGLEGGEAGRYRCRDGGEIHIASQPDPSLPAAIEEGATLREVIWGAEDQRSVDAIAEELSRDRKVSTGADGTVRSVDDMGLAIGFRVSRRQKIVAAPYQANTPGAPVRIDQRATFFERATPQEISHVVIGVPDLAPVEAFYRQRLGFRVSDRYTGRAVFLRAAPAGNHHHLFLLNSNDAKTHFNHICFKVRNVHEVIGGGQYIASRGWETSAGPGRHYVSSACFWYFKNPVAGAFEYAADEDVVSESWTGGEHEASPEIFSEWHFSRAKDEKVASPISSSRAA
jgi:catechol 2,3-dioxygenase-like lactoylglutathione lyase family enzyme